MSKKTNRNNKIVTAVGGKSNTMLNTGLRLIKNSQNRAALTFCLTVLWLEQSERRSSVRKERDEWFHLLVCLLLFFLLSLCVLCLFHLLVCQWTLLSLTAHNHLPPTHWSLMCFPHFLPACLLVDQAAGGCVDVGTTQASGPDCLEAALLSAWALDDCRIRLAWHDTDNNLQVHIEQGRGKAECENCTLLTADMLMGFKI